ncbi:MAG: aminopeptidase P family protein [Acholeplasmataceae bacterium]|jgi:Xaa-Pro aminopeptidase|nr:aminopeptidase P family protein [Acholeplasmataceae bacterium]
MYEKRRKQILKHMDKGSFALFSSGYAPKKSLDQHYPYFVNRNFYYLTGINQAYSYLLIIKGVIEKTILFVEKRTPERMLWDGVVLTFEEAKEISKVDLVMPNTVLDTFISSILSSTRAASYGPLDNVYFDFQGNFNIREFAEEYSEKLKVNYPYLKHHNLNSLLSSLRSIKDKEEIRRMKEAIKITDEGLNLMMKNAKPGMVEHELEAYFEYTLKKHGVTVSFNTIAASGPNGCILHYGDNNRKTEDNELILFDLGVYKDNYASDISRTFPLNGKFTELQKKYYEIVLECNKKCILFAKPGVTWKELNDYAKDILSDGLIKLGKIKEKEELSKYYYHSIGHYLGLDVHDVGPYTEPLKENQVITIEPGLYIAEDNIGIRIEDNILLTKDGSINLSKELIKEIKDIEAFMKK